MVLFVVVVNVVVGVTVVEDAVVTISGNIVTFACNAVTVDVKAPILDMFICSASVVFMPNIISAAPRATTSDINIFNLQYREKSFFNLPFLRSFRIKCSGTFRTIGVPLSYLKVHALH